MAADTSSLAHPWKKHAEATAYARELLQAQLRPIVVDVGEPGGEVRMSAEHGVQLLELKSALTEDERASPNHFSRECGRKVWDRFVETGAAEAGGRRSNMVIYGTPGVGKTRSIAYGLKKLLEAGRMVIVDFRRDRSMFAFAPRKDNQGQVIDCEAWHCSVASDLGSERDIINLDNKEGRCLIVDSFEGDRGYLGAMSMRKVVLTPAENSVCKNLIRYDGARSSCITPCTREELLAMHSVWRGATRLSRDEVESRFCVIGGVPRFVFACAQRYAWQASVIRAAACKLAPRQVAWIVERHYFSEKVGFGRKYNAALLAVEASPSSEYALKTSPVSEYARCLCYAQAYDRVAALARRLEVAAFFEKAALGMLMELAAVRATRLGERDARLQTVELALNHTGLCPVFACSQEDFFRKVQSLPRADELGGRPSPIVVASRCGEQGAHAAGARNRLYIAAEGALHPLRFSAIEPFLRGAGGECRKLQVVFVVRPEHLVSFTKQQVIECNSKQRREATLYIEQLAVGFHQLWPLSSAEEEL